MRAIFATRFLDAVSQQLSSQRSNKRSSARRRVSDEFPVFATHSHSPLQQALPLPRVLCHGFNNSAVDGSAPTRLHAKLVCVRGKRLLMSSTILCFDGKWVIWVSLFIYLFLFYFKEPKWRRFGSINGRTKLEFNEIPNWQQLKVRWLKWKRLKVRGPVLHFCL